MTEWYIIIASNFAKLFTHALHRDECRQSDPGPRVWARVHGKMNPARLAVLVTLVVSAELDGEQVRPQLCRSFLTIAPPRQSPPEQSPIGAATTIAENEY